MAKTLIEKEFGLHPTPVYDDLFTFIVERQNIFWERFHNEQPPYTDNKILKEYKFTNVYRASDRVSQYLLWNVINNKNKRIKRTQEDIFLRIILFKLFNKIETWEFLEYMFGDININNFNIDIYTEALDIMLADKQKIYSSAYIMPSGTSTFGSAYKHVNNLKLLQKMLDDTLPNIIVDTSSLAQVFWRLNDMPTIGPFLAFQYAIDLNYSNLIDYNENDFIIAGPGCVDGIIKCFDNFYKTDYTFEDIILIVKDLLEIELHQRNLEFKTLFGRMPTLIDIQNCFCEISKYARISHPDIQGKTERTKIKHTFSPNEAPIKFWYPPKWNINRKVTNEYNAKKNK